MGASSKKAFENVAIFAIKGTLPLPLGWSRPLVSRINENGEREYTVAGQAKSSWQSTEPLDQFEEEGFLTRLGIEIDIALSDIPESWIFYIHENQLRELPATTALLKVVLNVCNYSTKLPPLTKTDHPNEVEASIARFARLSNSQLQELRKKAFEALFDEIVDCRATCEKEIDRLHQTSLILIDLAQTDKEGANGIALSLGLLFETGNALQAQHWLNVVCTKFGFATSLQDWRFRAESLTHASKYVANRKLRLPSKLSNPFDFSALRTSQVSGDITSIQQVVLSNLMGIGERERLQSLISYVTANQTNELFAGRQDKDSFFEPIPVCPPISSELLAYFIEVGGMDHAREALDSHKPLSFYQ